MGDGSAKGACVLGAEEGRQRPVCARRVTAKRLHLSRIRAQAMAEFALAAPFFVFILLVIIQMGMIVMQQLSLVWVTRDTARWLATRLDTVDSAVLAHARANPLTLDPSRIMSALPVPGCPALDTTGICSLRSAAGVISVEITYDLSSWLFLPSEFGIGGLRASIPASLPPYRVTMMIE